MIALACLKIMVGDTLMFAGADHAGLVAKVAGVYLDSTWLWPRRYGNGNGWRRRSTPLVRKTFRPRPSCRQA